MKKKKKVKISLKKLFIPLIFLIIILLIFLLIEKVITLNSKYKEVNHSNDIKKSIKNNDNDNYKTVGWIDVYGTKLNFPIFHMSDSFEGSVKVEKFSWSYNAGHFNNFISIFGHNIMNLGVPQKNGDDFKRFEQLMAFVYPDFANEHRYIQLTLNDKNYVYEIFSVSIISAYNIDILPRYGATKEEIKRYEEFFRNYSIYKYNTKLNSKDDLILLSTCTRMYGPSKGYYDIAVVGKRVEKANNKLINIKKTNRYESIDKVLRGDKNE